MKIYQLQDGTLVGFYREAGAELTVQYYDDVYETQLVTKERQEEYTIPGFYETYDIITAGYWTEEEVFIPGRWERQMIWKPEYTVTRYREVPGYWETRTQWIPGYWKTVIVTRPADPVTGRLEISYEDKQWVPGYDYHRKVWVTPTTEEYEEIIPAGESMGRVWIEEHYETENIWIPETSREVQVWVPPEKGYKTVEYQVLEEVWVGQTPVYSLVDPTQATMFTVEDLIKAPADEPWVEDKVTVKNILTGEVLTTTAYYLGLATKVDDEEFVVP